MFEFLTKGGILVGPILFCSVIALGIFLERMVRFSRLSFKGAGLPEKVIRLMEEGKEDLALETAKRSNSPMGDVLAGALEVRGQNWNVVESVISHTIDEAVRGLSRFLQPLSTIGYITPMLGLLGTVMGMIKAFMVIQQMGGKVNAAILAGGIWEAMLTTALGLAVALPAMIAFNYLDSRVDNFEAQMRATIIALTKVMGAEYSGENR
jgi:biopolymer transport protein ExbB